MKPLVFLSFLLHAVSGWSQDTLSCCHYSYCGLTLNDSIYYLAEKPFTGVVARNCKGDSKTKYFNGWLAYKNGVLHGKCVFTDPERVEIWEKGKLVAEEQVTGSGHHTIQQKISRKDALRIAKSVLGNQPFRVKQETRKGRIVWKCSYSKSGGDGVPSSKQIYWVIIDARTGEVLENRGITTR